MTEEQLKAIPAFADLPFYDESDERAEVLTRPADGVHRVCECATIDEVFRCLGKSNHIPLGALRAWVNGGPIVVAYFAEKQ